MFTEIYIQFQKPITIKYSNYLLLSTAITCAHLIKAPIETRKLRSPTEINAVEALAILSRTMSLES